MIEATVSSATMIAREVRDQCLCLATQRAARLLARRFDRLFAPMGITNGQFSMMVALSGQWQPRVGELAAFLGMDSTTTTAAVKALEKKGFVGLVADARDARARKPQLTEAGRMVLDRAVPLWRAEHAALAEELGHDQAEDLRQGLGKIR